MVRYALIALVFACARRAPEGQGGGSLRPVEEVREVERVEVVGPVRWWDASGLCLEVPAGWRGRGHGEHGVLLTLVHEELGASFEVLLADAPRDRRDLVLVFADPGTYREIPALGPAGVESWTSDVPGGPSLHVWTAAVRGVPVRIEARYPFGRVFTGTEAVDQLLGALCVE